MMQMQAAAQQEEIKQYKEMIDELNREKRQEANKKSKPMPIIVSAVIGLAALFVLLSKLYTEDQNKFAVGTLSCILAYWVGSA